MYSPFWLQALDRMTEPFPNTFFIACFFSNTEKMPLPEYLRKGLEILEKPVRTETELEDFDEW